MNKRKIIIGVVWTGTIILLIFNLDNQLTVYRKLQNLLTHVELVSDSQKDELSYDQVNELALKNKQLKDPFSYIAWYKKTDETFSSPNFEKTVQADSFLVNGNIQVLLPKTAPIDRLDNACIISSKLAQTLFGGSEVKNLTIVYNEKKYHIHSVVPDEAAYFIGELTKEDGQSVNRLTVLTKKGQNKLLLTQLINNQLSVNMRIIDYEIYSILLSFILLTFFLLVMLCLIWYGWHFWGIQKQFVANVHCSFYFCPILIALGFVIYFFFKDLNISSEYLPTRLSNFEFFTNLFDSLRMNQENILQQKKSISEFQIIALLNESKKNLFMSMVTIPMILPWMAYYITRIRLKTEK